MIQLDIKKINYVTENRKHTQHTLVVYIKAVDLFSHMQEYTTQSYHCNYPAQKTRIHTSRMSVYSYAELFHTSMLVIETFYFKFHKEECLYID